MGIGIALGTRLPEKQWLETSNEGNIYVYITVLNKVQTGHI